MTTTGELPRSERLRFWMLEHYITNAALGEQLGISAQAVNRLLKEDTMPVRRHEKCLELGFPKELLPAPFDRPRGVRGFRKPIFPGLVAAPETNRA